MINLYSVAGVETGYTRYISILLVTPGTNMVTMASRALTRTRCRHPEHAPLDVTPLH